MGHERPEAAHATVGNLTTDEKLDQVLAQLAAMQARLADMDRENAQLRKDVEGSLANVSESVAKSIAALSAAVITASQRESTDSPSEDGDEDCELTLEMN